MPKSKSGLIILGVVIVLMIAIGGGFFLLRDQGLFGSKPPEAAIPSRPPSTMTVSLTSPVGATHMGAGEILPVHGQMISNYPIEGLELWVNGEIVEKRTPSRDSERTLFMALWNWKASEAGVYKLNLRGIDRDGRSDYSNMVSVVIDGALNQATGQQILPLVNLTQLTPAPAMEIDSPVIEESGGSAPTGPISGVTEMGGEEQVPPAIEGNPPLPEPDPPQENGNTDPPLGTVTEDFSFIISVNITRPEACEVDLEIEDLNHNATGFIIERSAPQDFDYYPITAISAGDGSSHYLDTSPKEEGSYYYIVTAFNHVGSQASQTYTVNFGNNCADESWNGVVFADFKVIPKEPAENFHCYYWLDNILWQRLPHPDGTSIPPMSAEELDLWNTNMGSLTSISGPLLQLSSPVGYDLTPFAPDLSQTGFSRFQFNLICLDRDEDKVTNLGHAEGELNLELPNKLYKMSADTGLFDAFIYLGTKVMVGNQPETTVGIASPYDFEASIDPAICPPESVTACEYLTDNNYVIFRWRWKPEPCFYGMPAPDNSVCVKEPGNFLIFRYTYLPQYSFVAGIDGGQPPASDGYYYKALPYPQENYEYAPSDTPAEKAKKDMLKTKSYCVRAESWNLQSADFQESCFSLMDMDMSSKMKTIMLLKPMDGLHDMGVYTYGEAKGDAYSVGGDFGSIATLPHQLFTGLGIDGDQDGGLTGLNWWNAFGYFKFDLTPVMGKQIHSASLMVGDNIAGSARIRSESGTDLLAFENACHSGLMVLNRRGSPGWHNAYPPDATVTNLSIAKTMDVTDEVRMWTDGTIPNHGFMFGVWPIITVENFTSWFCETKYGPINMTVEFSDK